VRDALAAFGKEAYYGLELIELVPAPAARGNRLILAELVAPGHILLYDQPHSPWRLGFELAQKDRARVRAAGARVDEFGVVNWPENTLRRFMLGDVLAHELGHHLLQHERRLRGEPAARTADHEARADAIAARLRAMLQ